MKMMKTLPERPMPNHSTASGIHAIGEIGRNSSTNGRMNRSMRSLRPITMPRGMAMAEASAHDRKMRPRLVPVCLKSWPDPTSDPSVSTTASGLGSRVVLRMR